MLVEEMVRKLHFLSDIDLDNQVITGQLNARSKSGKYWSVVKAPFGNFGLPKSVEINREVVDKICQVLENRDCTNLIKVDDECKIRHLAYRFEKMLRKEILAKSELRCEYRNALEKLERVTYAEHCKEILHTLSSKESFSSETLQKCIRVANKRLSEMSRHMEKAFTKHAFQNSLSKLTQTVSTTEHKEIWKIFLNTLHKKGIIYPESNQGLTVQLPIDLSREIDFLDRGYRAEIQTEILRDISSLTYGDIKGLDEVETSSFAPDENWDIEERMYWFGMPGSIVVISRDKLSSQVLGYILYVDNPYFCLKTVASVGSRASATRMGVGSSMMSTLLLELRKRRKLQGTRLQVRVSNVAAIKLYESFGFKKLKVLKNYYKSPTENGFLMKFSKKRKGNKR